jgi:hypothetical protein
MSKKVSKYDLDKVVKFVVKKASKKGGVVNPIENMLDNMQKRGGAPSRQYVKFIKDKIKGTDITYQEAQKKYKPQWDRWNKVIPISERASVKSYQAFVKLYMNEHKLSYKDAITEIKAKDLWVEYKKKHNLDKPVAKKVTKKKVTKKASDKITKKEMLEYIKLGLTKSGLEKLKGEYGNEKTAKILKKIITLARSCIKKNKTVAKPKSKPKVKKTTLKMIDYTPLPVGQGRRRKKTKKTKKSKKAGVFVI